jgi:hypothetical protein
MKLKFLTFALITLLPFNVWAQWGQLDQDGFRYVTTSDRGSFYYKIQRMETNYYKSADVWIKIKEKTKTYKNSKGKVVTTGGKVALSLITISCSNSRKYTVKKYIEYNSKGVPIAEEDGSYKEEYVIPGSIMDSIFDSICFAIGTE